MEKTRIEENIIKTKKEEGKEIKNGLTKRTKKKEKKERRIRNEDKKRGKR